MTQAQNKLAEKLKKLIRPRGFWIMDGKQVWSVAAVEACIDKLAATAVEIYCSKPDQANSHLWTHRKSDGHDTHRTFIFPELIEEIAPKDERVSERELGALINRLDISRSPMEAEVKEILHRIRNHGVKVEGEK